MKYSKKVREEAALICAIAASGGATIGDGSSRAATFEYVIIRLALGVSRRASILATDAWRNARKFDVMWTREVDAEAEALIRTGFEP